jgi:NAD(P)-dependent dehydrogenase (short-subunit alcohol dehydrogenase family)
MGVSITPGVTAFTLTPLAPRAAAAERVTKAAKLALTRALAAEYAEQGVRINAVAPGPTTGEPWVAPGGLLDQVADQQGVARDEALRGASERIPLKRFGDGR